MRPAAICGPAPASPANVSDPAGRQTRLQVQRWTDLYRTTSFTPPTALVVQQDPLQEQFAFSTKTKLEDKQEPPVRTISQ